MIDFARPAQPDKRCFTCAYEKEALKLAIKYQLHPQNTALQQMLEHSGRNDSYLTFSSQMRAHLRDVVLPYVRSSEFQNAHLFSDQACMIVEALVARLHA